jgi:asparagine synthase (glutamine-hydrolysing)
MEKLHHRGPDAQRLWESAEHDVCLGHTRLSIIDLSSGAQPIANEDETIRVVVNGEFYDFEAIREDLETRGHRFRTRSDSEILLHLYEDFGVECLRHLRGEYAFILWDARTRTLFAGRDRFGIKPLFYSHTGGRLTLGSEVKALHAAGVPAAWDPVGLSRALTFTGMAPTTLFRDVMAIPPAHFLLARGTDCALHKYWDWDLPREEDLPANRSDEDYAAEFGSVLDDAVRTRMRADVPVGCYLSGGIDSCTVLALMAKHAPGRVRAFSLSFDHALYDEAPIAREMAERAGAEFTMIPMRHRQIAEDLSDAVWHGETIFINGHCAAKFALSRAVRDAGYKVVVTGEGSDEVLAGYPFFRMDLIRHSGTGAAAAAGMTDSNAAALRAGNSASAGILLASPPVVPNPAFVNRLGYFPAWMETNKSNIERMTPALDLPASVDDVMAGLLDRLDIAGQMAGRHPVNQSLYLGNQTALPNYILTVLGDRMEMAHSIEGRLPFLDHKVVEYSRTLPVSQKIRGSVEKYVLREAMKPYLTKTVYERQKHPFLSPPALLKPEEPLHMLLQDTLRSKAMDRVPYFRREGAIQMLDNTMNADDAEKSGMEYPFMVMLTACLLGERFAL